MSLNVEFEALLHELEDARKVDDELHERGAPLEDRVASHERLVTLRADLARCRSQLGTGEPVVRGPHDSRTKRGAGRS